MGGHGAERKVPLPTLALGRGVDVFDGLGVADGQAGFPFVDQPDRPDEPVVTELEVVVINVPLVDRAPLEALVLVVAEEPARMIDSSEKPSL